MKISAKTRKRDRYLFFLCVTVSKFFFVCFCNTCIYRYCKTFTARTCSIFERKIL